MAAVRRRSVGTGRRPQRGPRPALAAVLAAVALLGPTSAVASAGPAGPTAGAAAASRGAGVRPVPGEVLAGFDPPASPYGPGQRGVRLTAGPGEAVRAARAGEVAFAGPVAGTPWVSVDHGGGLRTSYGPVRPSVAAGQRVAAGEVIGRMADGEEAGLHWGARMRGAYIDPLALLGRWQPVLVPRDGAPAGGGQAR